MLKLGTGWHKSGPKGCLEIHIAGYFEKNPPALWEQEGFLIRRRLVVCGGYNLPKLFIALCNEIYIPQSKHYVNTNLQKTFENLLKKASLAKISQNRAGTRHQTRHYIKDRASGGLHRASARTPALP